MFELSIMTPLVAVLVISFRVHRGIDVFAAIVSAIASCALAERTVDAVDWLLIQTDGAHPHEKSNRKKTN